MNANEIQMLVAVRTLDAATAAGTADWRHLLGVGENTPQSLCDAGALMIDVSIDEIRDRSP
jgi:hypothetical protein